MRIGTLGSVAISLVTIAAGVAASEPVRNASRDDGTLNPPQTAHPIFFPIGASTVANASPDGVTAEDLLREFMRRHTGMDYPAAAELALRLTDAAPQAPESFYNLACVMSRLQRFDESLEALDRAVERGWRELLHTTLDPDLTGIRSKPKFKQIIERMRELIEAERIVPGPFRQDDWHAIVCDLEQAAPQLLQRYRVPGMTVVLLRDGVPVWSGPYGVCDDASQTALKIDDQFALHAPSRLLALIDACELQSQGKLELAELLEESNQNAVAANNAREPQPRIGREARGTSAGADTATVQTIGFGRASNATSASTPSTPEVNPSRRDRSSEFFNLLIAAVEVGQGETLIDRCETTLFPRLGMSKSAFARAADTNAEVVTGYSRLGTPIKFDASSEDSNGALITNARDLALLIEGSLKQNGDAGIDISKSAADAVAFMNSSAANLSHISNQAFEVRQTRFGLQAQLAEINRGWGCLVRWLPQHGNGIVILFNSQTGMPAAERIAHIALGGE